MHKNTFTYPNLSIKNYENIFGEDDKNAWLKILIDELDWLEGEIKLFGKNIKIPRLQSWYADEGCNYKYSGKMLRRNNWHPVLLKIKQNIETVSGEKFNSVLANLYRDGSDSMGWHSDDESSIKQDTSIASVSFGEQRPIFFKHKTDDISFSIDQSHGSLIIMNGETQKFWKHSIKKSKKLMKPRINLTFRTIITS
ncbi:alpha-ketoglutarate-dependent dioxygenase AlkB [Gammaproteobacteria bacterium]|jgi:alkylated DNA repair dioxygenase AlkB|nr:alpha-ketoglutarate-dependent dioxygenase AlkB [Gammaproteobacteria bacterium]|tara:strand:- start:1176 stop:1763 length:588 start_codon:yes stop_codon:yes gene_type:complete